VSERATYGIIDEGDRKREAGFAIKINESDTRDMNGNTICVEYMYILEPAYPLEFPWFDACLLDRRYYKLVHLNVPFIAQFLLFVRKIKLIISLFRK